MTYIPSKKNNKAKIISGVLIFGGLAIWMLSTCFDTVYPVIAQMIAVVCICASIAVATRWIFCVYKYSLDNGDFVVTQVQRKIPTDVFRLPISDITEIKRGKEKSNGKRFNYNVTLLAPPSDCYTLSFDSYGERITILIECDEGFIRTLETDVQRQRND